MAKVHVTRKELKKDALQEVGLSLLEYWEAHWQKILWIAVGAVALIVAFRVGASVANKRQADASSMLVRAEREARAAALTTDPQQQAQLLKSANNYADELRSRYPSKPQGVEALYVKGNALLIGQEYDQAVSVYQNYVDQAKTSGDKAKAFIGMAYAKENKFFQNPANKDLLQQALANFEKAKDLGTDKSGKRSYLAYQAMLGMGRLLEENGETAKAADLYREVLQDRALGEEMKPAATDEGKEIDPEDREARLKEVRDEIRRIRAQFSFEQAAETSLEQLGLSSDAPTSKTK